MLELTALKGLADVLIEESAGFDYVRAFVTALSNREVTIRNREPEESSRSDSCGITLVGSRDGRTVTVSGSDTTSAGRQALVRSLTDLVAITDPDPHYVIPDPEWLGAANAQLDVMDPAILIENTDRMMDMARELETHALELDKRLFSMGASVSRTHVRGAFACSLGFSSAEESSGFSHGIALAVQDATDAGGNTGRRQRSGWSTAAVRERLLESTRSVAEQAAQRTLARLGAVKPATGKYPVVLDPSMSGWFFRHIGRALSGGTLYRKQSFLADSRGRQIASPLLSIREDPLLSHGLGSRRFDTDGVCARSFDVLREGVVCDYLLGVYAANRLGLKPNGCAGGSANLVVECGSGDMADLCMPVNEGILVTGLMGQGADIRTGDFSMGAEGFRIRDGRISEPLSEFTIASTFPEMLRGIDAIGEDPRTDSTVQAPSIRFSGLSIAGS